MLSPRRSPPLLRLRTTAPDPTPRLALVSHDAHRYLAPGQTLVEYVSELAAEHPIGSEGVFISHTVQRPGRPPHTVGYTSITFADENDEWPALRRLHEYRENKRGRE